MFPSRTSLATFGNIFAVAVQEVLGCFLELLRFVPDFDVDGCIHLNIDVVSGRHGVARLHIDRYQLQTQLVQPLKEWELDAGFTDQDPLAFLKPEIINAVSGGAFT